MTILFLFLLENVDKVQGVVKIANTHLVFYQKSCGMIQKEESHGL